MHWDCRKRLTARKRKLRNECRRANLGMFPFDRKPLEAMVTKRCTPTRATRRRYYRWLICKAPGCSERFYAARNAKWCTCCLNALRRERNRIDWIRRKARMRAAGVALPRAS